MIIARRLGLAAGLVLAAGPYLPGQSLNIGDKAPALTGVRWIKGEPVRAFAPGQVYVVELWATWCGPCKANIPHLTELARTFQGKVTILGVSVNEKKQGPGGSGTLKAVEAFVAAQGERMGYTVGTDGPEGFVSRAWLDASGTPGIPTAFVVNGQGVVGWFGHPKDLEGVLKATLDGTYDLAKATAASRAESASRQADRVGRKEEKAAMEAFFGAMKRGDYPAAVKAGDALFPRFPKVEQAFGHVFYMALAQGAPARAEAYARSLAEGPFRTSAGGLGQLLQAMLRNPAQGPELPLAIARQALALPGQQQAFWTLDIAAQVHAKAGQYPEAADLERRALEATAAPGEEVGADFLDPARARLTEYRGKAAAAPRPGKGA